MAGKTRLFVDVAYRPGFREQLSDRLYAKGAREALEYIVSKVAASAQSFAPASLSSKIKYRVAKKNPPHSAVVRVAKSGVGKRATFIHGPINRRGPERSKPHMPPPARELQAWATAHGIPVGAAMRAVAARGAPFHPFLRQAREANAMTPQAAVKKAERIIEQEWRRGG